MMKKTVVCLLVAIFMAGMVQAKDIVTITSDKTAVVDKTKGTAVWKKNVIVTRKSTGSNMTTDRLSIQRELAGKRIIWAEADGNVKALYFRTPQDANRKSSENQTPQKPVVHTRISCDLATFSRKTRLAILSGAVDVQSADFDLQAEKIVYHYDSEKGTLTAKRGEQVRFVFYKKLETGAPNTIEARSDVQKVSGVADEMRFDRQSRKAVLQGSVHIIDHSDQSQFRSDRSELFFDKQEEIETIVASGNFSMNQPERYSKADRAVFEYATEEVTLIGNAYVKENNNMEVRSARIKMLMKANQGIISGDDDIPVEMKIEIE